MDNKQIFHIAGEVIVVGCISLYFINQIKKLNEEITTLKDELKSQKEVSTRNFNQIYAILNSAFNIPVMPVRETSEKLRKDPQEVISDVKESHQSRKTLENKDPFLETDTDEEEEKYPVEKQKVQRGQIVSKEQFSHDTSPIIGMQQMVRGPNISMVSMMTPIMGQLGQMDGVIINIEENLGPRKRNVRNNEVEISDVTGTTDKSYLLTETKKDMDDNSDEEIEDELELLGIQPPKSQSVETKEADKPEIEIEKNEESFTIDTSATEEEKPVKITKRKKNLKNSS